MPKRVTRPRRNVRRSRNTAKWVVPSRPRRTMRRMRMYRPLTAFPLKRVVKLKYCQIAPLNRVIDGGTGATASSYYYSCNSIYDPDCTKSGAPGHQPYFYDQLSALYSRYSVLSSKATIRSVTAGAFILFGRVDRSWPTTSSGGSNVPITFLDPFTQADLERPGTKHSICVAAKPGRVSLKWNCKQATFDRSENTTTMSSDPPSMDFFRFGGTLLTSGGAEGTGAFGSSTLPQCVITIEYTVLLTEPVQQAMS